LRPRVQIGFHSYMNEMPASVLAPTLVQLAALGRDAHITRVAQATGTSQPTLSRALRSWEAALGISILTANGRGVELTEDGRVLAAAAADSLRVLESAIGRIRSNAAEAPLTVGFLRSLGPTVAGELMASFLVSRPQTVIAHREGSSTALLRELGSDQLDVAITAPRPPGHLSWMALGKQALVLVVPTSHRFATAREIDLATVRDDAFLALDNRFDARRRADALCVSAGFTPRVVLEADDLMTIRGYIATGMGIAVLPADASLSPRTASIPLTNPDAHRTFGLAWDAERASTAALALIAHAEELASKYPGWADIQA
jgi:LysR family transcriptional regulator, transcription activator of glutamate synthase operon